MRLLVRKTKFVVAWQTCITGSLVTAASFPKSFKFARASFCPQSDFRRMLEKFGVFGLVDHLLAASFGLGVILRGSRRANP